MSTTAIPRVQVVEYGLVAGSLRGLSDGHQWALSSGMVDSPRHLAALGAFLSVVQVGSATFQIGGRTERLHSSEGGLFWGGIAHELLRVEPDSILHGVYVPIETMLLWIG